MTDFELTQPPQLVEATNGKIFNATRNLGAKTLDVLRQNLPEFSIVSLSKPMAKCLIIGSSALLGSESTTANGAIEKAQSTSGRSTNYATPWKQCDKNYNAHDSGTWICATIKGPHNPNGDEEVIYRYSFKPRRTLRKVTLAFGGDFEKSDGEVPFWRHTYPVLKKGHTITKKISATPHYETWGTNVVMPAVSRHPGAQWRVIGEHKKPADSR